MSNFVTSRSLLAASVLGLLGLSAQAETLYGFTQVDSQSTSPGLQLVRFDSATPGNITTVGSFSGLVAGQTVRSIDFRPATGQLYAISFNNATSAAQLYTVNLNTAALTSVGSGFALTGSTSPRVEIDFNPVVDRIRIVTGSDTANNYRANPDTGALVQADTSLSWSPGDVNDGFAFSILGAAYSNNVAGAASTTLYAWDYESDSLLTIGGPGGTPSPNGGVMSTVAAPGSFLTSGAALGMDISGTSGTLYVTHDDPTTGTVMSLYTRSTSTGAQTLIGSYPAGTFIGDISVQITPVPEPGTWAMFGLGLAAVALRGLKRQRARD